MISYKFTDDFTVTQYGFNSCLGTYDMKINEATIVDGSGDEIKVCNEYNLKIYSGADSTANSPSTLVWDSDDPNLFYNLKSF